MIWTDGIVSTESILASDRGYLIGDGVFETMLLVNGRIIFNEDHRRRLRRGMETLGMSGDPPDFQGIADALNAAERERAALRCTVSRIGGRGLSPPNGARLRIVASLNEAPEVSVAPVTLARTRRTRLSSASTAMFKCIGGYAESVLARMDALAAGADEALMMNESGDVVCASAANLFCVMDEMVITPPVDAGAIPGCARAEVARCCVRLGVAFVERPFGDDELAAPLFISNSLIGLRRGALGGAPSPCAVFDLVKANYEAEVLRQSVEPL
jgi:branched-subunit amino acid aminotransferase/4-amino-4-deoxychorismate lyase